MTDSLLSMMQKAESGVSESRDLQIQAVRPDMALDHPMLQQAAASSTF